MKQRQPLNAQIYFIKNTGKEEELKDLLQFRNIVNKQLYLMSPIIVTKTLFDGIHESMILKNGQNDIIGGICFYEITQHKCVDIIYFAIDSKYQVQGYGTYLMANFKEAMRERKHETIATQADTISLNFYYKNGFIQFQKKNRKLERQPREDEIEDNDNDQDVKQKYKKCQPWLQYIEDYYSSILVVYKIPPKINFKSFSQMVNMQYTGLISQLDSISYRKLRFTKENSQKIIKQHLEKYEKEKGILFNRKKIQQIKHQLENKQYSLASSYETLSILQQIALLDVLKNHSCSWVLKMNFIKLSDSFHDLLSNLITISLIQSNVINEKYSSSHEMCADLRKLFENLKLFLAHNTNYYEACEKLETYMSPYISSIMQGTFNAPEYFKKKPARQEIREESRQSRRQERRQAI